MRQHREVTHSIEAGRRALGDDGRGRRTLIASTLGLIVFLGSAQVHQRGI